MNAATLERLTEERKRWRKDPLFGFIARPSKNADGTLNLTAWDCVIPGPRGTAWEGGKFKMSMQFTSSYPIVPPSCKFNPNFFHPNVYTSGYVCLSILNIHEDWRPEMSVKQILLSIQTLLADPNISSPANFAAAILFDQDRAEYEKRVRVQALTMNQTVYE